MHFLAFIAAALLFWPAATATAQDQPKVGLRVLSPAGGERIVLPGTLPVDSITVEESFTIRRALEAARFVPDADALALVYSLNPTLSHADTVAAGTRLAFPSLRAVEGVGPDDRVKVLFEPELRREVIQDIAAAAAAAEGVRASPAAPREQVAAARKLRELRGELLSIDVGAAPITSTVLQRLETNAEIIEQNAVAVRSGRTLSEADRQALSQIDEEVEAIAEASATGGAVKVLVTVTPSGSNVTGLHLFYATQSHFDSDQCKTSKSAPCRNLFSANSPKHQTKLNSGGDYVVWAERVPEIVSCPLNIKPVLKVNTGFTLPIPAVMPDDERCGR